MMLKKIEIGGIGPKLQLVHANAYTPECYFQFAQYFEDSYHVHFLRQRPLWANQSPGQLRHWELFADDLIDMMEEHGDTQVIGLGHSLGAVATCMASIKRPDLFKQVVLIDPVFINRGRIDPLRLMPIVLRDRLFPLIKIAANRRNMWADRTEAREHLGSKKVFQRFDPKVFDDFLNYALVDCADGVTLAYPRSWEARVYETAPYVWSLIKKISVPTLIIKAEYSDVISQKGWQRIKKLATNSSFHEFKGAGHLVPFENPEELAKLILSHI